LIVFFHLYCRLGGEPTGEPTRDDLMVDEAGTNRSIQAVALLLPATACCCNAWRWLVVAFSAEQKQQLHHQQVTNGSTILKAFTFPVNLDLFNLSTVSFGSILAKISEASKTFKVETKTWHFGESKKLTKKFGEEN
jgi:hypothetical protein